MRFLTLCHQRRTIWCFGIFVTVVVFLHFNYLTLDSQYYTAWLSMKYKQNERNIFNWKTNKAGNEITGNVSKVIGTSHMPLLSSSSSSSSLSSSSSSSSSTSSSTSKTMISMTTSSNRLDERKLSTLLLQSSSKSLTTTNLTVQRVTTTTPTTTTISCSDPFLATFQREKKFVYENIPGGLGNHMFQYASAYGIAIRLNRTMLVERKRSLNNCFDLEAIKIDECIIKVAKVKHENAAKACSFDERLFHLPPGENIAVGLYLQSWKYFENVVPQVKKQFTFKTPISNKAEQIIRKASADFFKTQTSVDGTAKNITFVGIHVRRSDIVNEKRFRDFGYQVAPKQYIDKAMAYFTKKFINVQFMVCSDNMTWTQANIKHPNVVFVHGNSPEVDMSMLVQCNHTILTVGTFGWWSGFLSGGITLYYKHPVREDSALRNAFSKNYSDYFYPGWIGME
ncbi:galactoside alpha-(1,2)-fucosyltransferase 2-like isoform X2 [Gigantopelta aegis]|nr:galactoside alpha-(1,2)-fucosyltransferase 2-like isoform X2 [Gigantopelta aegis]